MKTLYGIIWLPLLIIIATLAVVGVVGYGVIQTRDVDQQQIANNSTIQNINQVTNSSTNTPVPPNNSYLTSSTYCEKDSDCIAVPNPNNNCYKAYFNIYATDEIEAYKAQDRFMIQDCPYYGPAICLNHVCAGKALE